MEKIIKQLEAKRNKVNEEAERFVLLQIEKLCRENKWEFKSVWGMSITNSKGEELYDTEIDKLVSWFEDNFCLLGSYVNKNGRWITGQTPLIRFASPRARGGVLEKC
jgi:hypothetical protein